jgi:hypothetical protein
MPGETQQLCFVVSPIGAVGGPERAHADWLLKGIIEPVFAQHFKDYIVERADKINVPGMIDSQVINRLIDADLVIADMSLLNANAFYEMGIRHMKQKPIIHMYRAGDKIPFDVAPYRAISFSYAHPDDLLAAQVLLKAAVDEVIKPGYQVENPVTRARGYEQLEQNATPGQQVILSEVRALTNRVAELESAQAGSAPRILPGVVGIMGRPRPARGKKWPVARAGYSVMGISFALDLWDRRNRLDLFKRVKTTAENMIPGSECTDLQTSIRVDLPSTYELSSLDGFLQFLQEDFAVGDVILQ